MAAPLSMQKGRLSTRGWARTRGPSWVRPRALATAILPPEVGAVLRTRPLPAHRVLRGLTESLEYFLSHPVFQSKHGAGGGWLSAASGLVDQVVWLIRESVCVVCSVMCQSCEHRGWRAMPRGSSSSGVGHSLLPELRSWVHS